MAARHRKCPTPTKRSFASRDDALTVLRSMKTNRLESRAYRCRGHWHLTSGVR